MPCIRCIQSCIQKVPQTRSLKHYFKSAKKCEPLENTTFSGIHTSSFFKRRGWDSNPRALSDKRFSRPPRYDHFDTSPHYFVVATSSATSRIISYIVTLVNRFLKLFSLFFHFFFHFFIHIFSISTNTISITLRKKVLL